MTRRQVREVGDALAFAMGDRRGLIYRCGWCDSKDVDLDPISDAFHCARCGRATSATLAAERRDADAREEISAGVGGPLLDAIER